MSIKIPAYLHDCLRLLSRKPQHLYHLPWKRYLQLEGALEALKKAGSPDNEIQAAECRRLTLLAAAAIIGHSTEKLSRDSRSLHRALAQLSNAQFLAAPRPEASYLPKVIRKQLVRIAQWPFGITETISNILEAEGSGGVARGLALALFPRAQRIPRQWAARLLSKLPAGLLIAALELLLATMAEFYAPYAAVRGALRTRGAAAGTYESLYRLAGGDALKMKTIGNQLSTREGWNFLLLAYGIPTQE